MTSREGASMGNQAVRRSKLVGMTERGVDIFNALGALIREFGVLEEHEGKPMVRTSQEALNEMRRQMEGLWRRAAGIERNPLNEEILGELVDDPRTVEDLARRIVKKGATKSLEDVRKAVEALVLIGVLTDRLEEIYVLS
jgi:hypothetical protein